MGRGKNVHRDDPSIQVGYVLLPIAVLVLILKSIRMAGLVYLET
jgi:hypothetical protein